MAILEQINNEDVGIKKVIDEGAEALVFQAIQEDIYSYPIKSFVRETISNALDAHTERDIALKIHAGAPVTDFYLDRTDTKLLKDSSFDPEYTKKTEFISTIPHVNVAYNIGVDRDEIAVRDNGVGLGGDRLKGFFKIGYSSKRNLKAAIGKFGAGAKSGLATGVEFFTVITRYNGYETAFMIYKTDYEPITPETAGGKEDIWSVEMANGKIQDRSIYWKPTTDPNGVEIRLEVKKHNKKAFIDAVKSQFQYFKGRVHFRYPDYSDTIQVDKMEDNAFYESNNLIIPKYSTYSTPHILVDGISYGTISWDELELDHRKGKVAIKVFANDVDITQSRETLKWTEKTKKTILTKIKLANSEATDYITNLLKLKQNDNLFELNNKYGLLRKSSDNEVSSVFSKFLDMTDIKPQFDFSLVSPGTEKFEEQTWDIRGKVDNDLFEFLFYKFDVFSITLGSTKGKVKINKDKVEDFGRLRGRKIVYTKDSSLGPKRVQYLMNTFDTTEFIYIKPNTTRTKWTLDYGKHENISVLAISNFTSNLLTSYGDVNLEDHEWDYENDKEEDLEKETTLQYKNTAALLRKQNQEVLYQCVDYFEQENYCENNRRYNMKAEIKISNLEEHFSNWNEVIICTQEYRELGRLVEGISHSKRKALNKYAKTGDDAHVIYVAEAALKHFLPHGIHITEYFRKLNEKTGELMVGQAIYDFNTRYQLHQLLNKYDTFSRTKSVMESVPKDLDYDAYRAMGPDQTGMYKDSFPEFLKNAYKIEGSIIDNIVQYLDSLNEFQNIVKTGVAGDISEAATRLFGSNKVHTVDAYDVEFIEKLEATLEEMNTIEPILKFFNEYDNLGVDTTELLHELITIKLKQNVNS